MLAYVQVVAECLHGSIATPLQANCVREFCNRVPLCVRSGPLAVIRISLLDPLRLCVAAASSRSLPDLLLAACKGPPTIFAACKGPPTISAACKGPPTIFAACKGPPTIFAACKGPPTISSQCPPNLSARENFQWGQLRKVLCPLGVLLPLLGYTPALTLSHL
jgi:hypothetical protein